MEQKLKYARIIYNQNTYECCGDYICNIGDWFQTFAVDNLYAMLSIDKNDIICIPRNELSTYSGEQVLLPMQACFGKMRQTSQLFPLSKKIKPIFLGFNCRFIDKTDADELRKYAPIGCRDEATYLAVKRHRIPAFISGCMTITLPLYPETKTSRDKIAFVDIPSTLMPNIPEHIKNKAVHISHDLIIDKNLSIEEQTRTIEEKAKEVLTFYQTQTCFAVTSRLHCAIPHLAFGVPVILARDAVESRLARDHRFSFIDKYLKIYYKRNFKKIKWDIEAPEISIEKKLVTDFAIQSIACAKIADSYTEVHDLYINRRGRFAALSLFTRCFLDYCAIRLRSH